MSPLICTEQHQFLAAPHAIGELHQTLERFWQACDATPFAPPEGRWRLFFATAVGEVGANIVRHAYAGMPVGMIDLRLRLVRGMVVARFADAGRMYVPQQSASLAELDHWLHLPEAGRGLQIVRASIDHTHYRRTKHGINMWRLVKHI